MSPRAAPALDGYRLCSHVRYRVIDGEAIVLRQQAAEVLGINQTGARILESLERHEPIERMVATLVNEFKVGPDQARTDVERFLQALVADAVVEMQPDAAVHRDAVHRDAVRDV